MEMSLKNEEMGDKQSAFVASTEADESSPNSEVDSTSELLYQLDNMLLKNILEEEIWILILDKVKYNPEDGEACTNATPYFRDLLWEQRKEFLFPKVIDLLAVRNEERENYWDYNEYRQERPRDYKVWRETVMNCRLICQAWNKGVEKCYQKSEMSGIPELVSDKDPRTRLKTRILGLDCPWTNWIYITLWFECTQKFLHYFQKTHCSGVEALASKNPFFSRFMSFTWVNTYVEGIDEYMAGITTILEIWGREIRYCYLHTEVDFEKAPQHWRPLAHWLALMPNLKYLKLMGPTSTGELAADFFVQNPVPTLDKLEALDLTLVGTRIINELLSKNNHISILTMFGNHEIDEHVIRSLTNLKGLFTSRSRLSDKIVEEYGVGWKLNKLTFEPCDVSMTGANLFLCLQNKWASTLTELELREPFVGKIRLGQSKSLRLDLPYLRSLSLKVWGSVFLDFILPSQNSLEHLKIKQDRVDEDVPAELSEREQIIEYVGFEEKMLESNIWELFPKLKTLRRHKVLYERNKCLSQVPTSKYFRWYS